MTDFTTESPDIIQPTLLDSQFFSIPDFSLDLTGPTIKPEEERPAPVEEYPIIDHDDQDTPDFWLLPYENPFPVTKFHTWDTFQHASSKGPKNAYISEAGAHVFDAAIASKEDYLHINNADHVVVDAKLYRDALISLGSGRSSALFIWDEEKCSFRQAQEKLRISGYSGEALFALLDMFMDCGNHVRYLRGYVELSYRKQQSPGQVALAEVLSSVLETIEKDVSGSAATSVGLLQLQVLYAPAHKILHLLTAIVKKVSTTEDDEELLSVIFKELQIMECQDNHLLEVFQEVFSRVAQPWLEFANEWIGLQRESGLPMSKTGTSKAFVRVENREWVNEQGEELQEPDYGFDITKVPSFVEAEEVQLMFEVGKSLRLLRSHHPDHALAKVEVIASANPPLLNVEYSWTDILSVERKTLAYEQDLIAAITSFSTQSNADGVDSTTQPVAEAVSFDFFGKPTDTLEAHFLASIKNLNHAPAHRSSSDQLSSSLHAYLHQSRILEPDSGRPVTTKPDLALATCLSLSPVVMTQARVVNGTLMRMLFKSHSIREHLSIQRQFHLLDNGVFSSRLSHALFDPELETAERQRGVAMSGGIMGLRLGGRDAWPPASSELRLALMGILSESYSSGVPGDNTRANTFLDDTSIPGDLSFAVRDMSEQEIEACRNANSLQALDFLRLSYKPPPPLDAVITPVILFKYDQIFRLLLRLLRMLYVATTFFRKRTNALPSQANPIAQRFRIEARHFITSVSDYFFESGIKVTWRTFERKLDQLEARIQNNNAYALSIKEGINNLRDYHEAILDKIMFNLLLRKRQTAVMNLLEQIFGIILKFSELERRGSSTEEDEVRKLYVLFKQKVVVFINVCRGMSDKKGYGEKDPKRNRTLECGGLFDGGDLVEDNTISQLLLRLDMSGYYS